ncbi:MAG TPA: autorepressor SdpR family transcription factor [Lapidilactobacillus dextrinicus]|jgi:DNA-binding transcriptional ArsR family regulator|nr:autorepressor SdpR family transcription factor [Lapidilactobacillus dextrinicus]HJE15007.1 autorepressor SdpR family transcription factor [Lapidilactobacillus dextrinicus]
MGLSESMKVLADPVRRQIIEKLKSGPKTAGEIADSFELTNATVSYHLKLLKKAGFIAEMKDKNFIYYSLNSTVFEDILTWIYQVGGKKHDEQH